MKRAFPIIVALCVQAGCDLSRLSNDVPLVYVGEEGWPGWATVTGVSAYEDERADALITTYQHNGTGQTLINLRAEGSQGGLPVFGWLAGWDGRPFGGAALTAQNAFTVTNAGESLLHISRYEGDILWENTEVGPHVGTNVAISPDGVGFVASRSMAAVGPDGATLWVADLPADTNTNLIHDGVATAFVAGRRYTFGSGTTDVFVSAVNTDTGLLRWQTLMDSEVYALSMGTDAVYGLVYDGLGGANIVALAREDGAVLWQAEGFGTPIVGPDETLYAAGWRGLHAIRSDGTLLWTRTDLGYCSAPSLGADNNLYLACGPPGSTGHALVAPIVIDAEDGEQRWPEGTDDISVGWALTGAEPGPLLARGQARFVTGVGVGTGNVQLVYDGAPPLAIAPWPTPQGDSFGRFRLWGSADPVEGP